jgi:hypothetical protein
VGNIFKTQITCLPAHYTFNVGAQNQCVYDMIYLLTAVGLPAGCSNTVHIYSQTVHRTTKKNKQTIHRTTQIKKYIEQHKNKLEQCGPCPVLVSYTLAFALQLSEKHRKTSAFGPSLKYLRGVTSEIRRAKHVQLVATLSTQNNIQHTTNIWST